MQATINLALRRFYNGEDQKSQDDAIAQHMELMQQGLLVVAQ